MADAVDDYLEHFGVKGMKWGKHKSSSSSSSSAPKKTRSELRALNKEARAKGRAENKAEIKKLQDEHDAKVNKARDEVDAKAQKYNEAKKQYKIDKKEIGKVAAKQILKKHENDFVDSWNTATLQTTKEAHANLIAGVGLIAVGALVSGAASASRNSW
jgi:molecular chaperone GrpE (heat shock protein)